MSWGDALRLFADRLNGPAQFYQVPGVQPTDDDSDTYQVTVRRDGRKREVFVLARNKEEARELVLSDVKRTLLD